jgi:hypothetical protein
MWGHYTRDGYYGIIVDWLAYGQRGTLRRKRRLIDTIRIVSQSMNNVHDLNARVYDG